MKITKGMVSHLNTELDSIGCKFCYVLDDEFNNPVIVRQLHDDLGFVDSAIINCTDKFYDWLNDFFMTNYKIKLHYNHTKNICWSDDYS